MGGDTTKGLDLSEIADAIDVEPSDEELVAAIKADAALVGPILAEVFKAYHEKRDFWLKKASLRIFVDWVVSLQNIATIMEQQLEALSSVVTAQEAELEELRPTKKKIWTPFS